MYLGKHVEDSWDGFMRDEVVEFLLELFGEGFEDILKFLGKLGCGVISEFFIAGGVRKLSVGHINAVIVVENYDGAAHHRFICCLVTIWCLDFRNCTAVLSAVESLWWM